MAEALIIEQAGTEKSLVDVLSFERVSVHGVANMPSSNVRSTDTGWRSSLFC